MFNFLDRILGAKISKDKPTSSGRGIHEPSCPAQMYPTRERMHYNLGDNVFGFPSSGGMLQKRCSKVELSYLGLSSDQDIPKFEDPVAEDAFCQKLRLLGAVFWPSMGHWMETEIGEHERTGAELIDVQVGWPEDGRGVWVGKWDYTHEHEARFLKLDKARTMGERCQLIREMGGTFYDDLKESSVAG